MHCRQTRARLGEAEGVRLCRIRYAMTVKKRPRGSSAAIAAAPAACALVTVFYTLEYTRLYTEVGNSHTRFAHAFAHTSAASLFTRTVHTHATRFVVPYSMYVYAHGCSSASFVIIFPALRLLLRPAPRRARPSHPQRMRASPRAPLWMGRRRFLRRVQTTRAQSQRDRAFASRRSQHSQHSQHSHLP